MKRRLFLAVLISAAFCGAALAQRYAESDPLRAIDDVIYDLEDLVDESRDRELADKAEDVLSKLEDAAKELSKDRADYPAAAGNIEGAIGDLEAAFKDRLLDSRSGIGLMDDLVAISRGLATSTLAEARSRRANRNEIREARNHLARGDALRASGRRGSIGAFKRAANQYKDALSKAESAID